VHVDGARVAGEVVAPNLVQELIAREGAPAVAHQEGEQLVLLRLERQWLAGAKRLSSREVDRDLALLGVDTRQLTPLRWEPETLGVEIGKPVIGLANPGGRGLRATIGFVSAGERSFRGPRGRRITGGFEHTALAPAGSSGGPVVDPDGSLVGINTRRLGRGFYLAQTADTGLRDLISSLRRGDQPQPRRLGIGLAPAEVARRLRRSMGLDDVPGLLVRLVEGGSPAEASGVREGDVLVTADGVPIGDVDDLHQILASAGDSVDIGLVRVNEHLMVTIRFP